jgi:hypothetical protein
MKKERLFRRESKISPLFIRNQARKFCDIALPPLSWPDGSPSGQDKGGQAQVCSQRGPSTHPRMSPHMPTRLIHCHACHNVTCGPRILSCHSDLLRDVKVLKKSTLISPPRAAPTMVVGGALVWPQRMTSWKSGAMAEDCMSCSCMHLSCMHACISPPTHESSTHFCQFSAIHSFRLLPAASHQRKHAVAIRHPAPAQQSGDLLVVTPVARAHSLSMSFVCAMCCGVLPCARSRLEASTTFAPHLSDCEENSNDVVPVAHSHPPPSIPRADTQSLAQLQLPTSGGKWTR